MGRKRVFSERNKSEAGNSNASNLPEDGQH
jgi:hypothetical protein